MNTSPNGKVCIYHGNCFDGICAAWVVWKKYPDATFIPANYGDKHLMTNIFQDCCENANINTEYILVDFSFPRDLMEMMASKAKSMLVIDHHKTAEEDCKGLDYCVFDLNESGASLAWRTLHPNRAIPDLVKYVADRDLWRFQLPNSAAINAYIQSFPMTIEAYERLCYDLYTQSGMEVATRAGEAIQRYKDSLVTRICENHRIIEVAGYKAAVVNCSILMSEVGEYLAKIPGVDFGAYYFHRKDGMTQWGARSIGDFDVSLVAKEYGGGGHKNASGWQVARETLDGN